ncbi:MAG: ABC transporter permease [Rhodospirillaceae bacterium]|nr:ABC transporter permease [Rhodospirillaceae bacterium]
MGVRGPPGRLPPRPPRPRRLHASFVAGVALTGLVAAMAGLGLVWTPYDHTAQAIVLRLQGPGGAHWLGTDQYGRDVLSMIMVGAGNSILVGAGAVGLGAVVGIPLGLVAAARAGRWPDLVVGRLVDVVFAFPAILSAVLISVLMGPGAATAILAIGTFNIAVFARVTRGAALGVYAREFVRAALALGRRRSDIAIRHVLPNASGVLIVQATIQFAVAILAEAALSYLGLGIQPPQPSWGKMLFDAQTLMFMAPLQAVFPGLAIAIAVMGLNLLGDGLRDLLDPRLGPRRTTA